LQHTIALIATGGNAGVTWHTHLHLGGEMLRKIARNEQICIHNNLFPAAEKRILMRDYIIHEFFLL
jgi:hypothetical protein